MKRPSLFLLIKLKAKDKPNLYLILPLFVIRMIFQGLIFYKFIIEKILEKKLNKYEVDIDKIINAIEILWYSITDYREEDFVDIETRDINLKIRFI